MKLMQPFEERGWNENIEYYEDLNEMIEWFFLFAITLAAWAYRPPASGLRGGVPPQTSPWVASPPYPHCGAKPPMTPYWRGSPPNLSLICYPKFSLCVAYLTYLPTFLIDSGHSPILPRIQGIRQFWLILLLCVARR